MTDEIRLRLKITSCLLQFPDEQLVASLDSIEEAARALPMERPRVIFEDLLARMRRMAIIELQEDYTRVFDLNPTTSLNLTYRQCGDERRRGEALVRLSSVYRNAGYENSCNDLPDFLPMVLEFLAIAPAESRAAMLDGLGGEIGGLAARLKEAGTVYASLLDALDGIVQCSS